jgi:hypothetical protein
MALRLSALCDGRQLFTPRKIPVPISVTERIDPRAIMLLEGLGKLKNPITLLGLETATYRLAAQCLWSVQNCS